jgi:VWFA-related protein
MSMKYLFGPALIAVAALAQAPAPVQKTAPQPILRATTRLVQVSVIVQRHGQPVADLKKEDFQIRDNGRPQRIDEFSVQSTTASSLPKAASPLPPGIFTNQLVQRPGSPASVTIILLDNTNTNVQNQMVARQQVLKYLQIIKPEDHIGIYTFANGLKVLHSFMTDSSDLVALLANYKGKEIPDLSQANPAALDGDMVQLNRFFNSGSTSPAERDFYMIDRVRGILKAIEFIANNVAAMPGRKNLIWVSGGFPQQMNLMNFRDPTRIQEDFSPAIAECIRALNNANLAIYPVDSRGLMTDNRWDASNQSVSAKAMPKAPIGSANQSTMEELASRTGGRAYYNNNDLKKAISEAVDDSRVVYTLGFYPASEVFDGKYHKLDVKVPGEGGLSLHYRKGYTDSPEPTSDPNAAMAEMRDAVFSPLDSTALGVIVAAKADAKNPTLLNMAVQVEPKGISLQPEGDRWAGRLDVLIIETNDRGEDFNGTDQTVTLNLSKENYDKIVKGGFVLRKTVQMASQAKKLKVIVRDAPSGAIGSVTVPFSQLTH